MKANLPSGTKLEYPKHGISAVKLSEIEGSSIATSVDPSTVSNVDKGKTNKHRYISEIQAMMYTCGDVRNVQQEAAQIMEELVHAHLVDVVIKAAMIALRRNGRSLTTEDVMFTIRRDLAKVQRLKEFITWKDLRKNVKPVDETTASAVAVVSGGNAPEAEDIDEISKKAASKRKVTPRIPWDYISTMVAEATDGVVLDFEADDGLNSSFWDRALKHRLEKADNLTKLMGKDEYLEYSECRQASFTYKKTKKFREWLNPSTFNVEYRLSDDVIEVLGFLAGEAVHKITEVALSLKNRMEERTKGSLEHEKVHDETLIEVRKQSFFNGPREKTPIQPIHLYYAIRSIQKSNLFLLHG